jgi:hypothetical protein
LEQVINANHWGLKPAYLINSDLHIHKSFSDPKVSQYHTHRIHVWYIC